MSSYRPILPTQSDDAVYISVQQSEQVSNSSECSCRLHQTRNNYQSQPCQAIQLVCKLFSESILRQKEMPQRDTLPLAALHSPFNVQTQEQTHHDQWWTYTQLNVWWSRLKFNYQLSYFKAKSCRYCKCQLVHKVSTLGGLRQYWTPFGTTGTIKNPLDGWKM